MPKVDLHIHSNASDGRLSPAEVVRQAVKHGLSVIAITDHDTVDGIASALITAKGFPGLKVIPGIELSTDVPQGEVHILGYFIAYTDHEFQAILEGLRDSRIKRALGMVAKLKKLDIHIDWKRVQEMAKEGSIGRPHIAQAMLEKGYISSLKEAFDKYISRDGPAYVEREKMTPVEAVELIIKFNGLPVLAHPFTTNNTRILTAELKIAGLVGIETYYKDYTADDINELIGLADKYDLITTGGTDYHGLEPVGETIIGGVEVPMGSAEHLIALAKDRALNLTGL